MANLGVHFFFQILLDVVSVFNMVSSLSQKEQSVKFNQVGIEVGFVSLYIWQILLVNIFLMLSFGSKLVSLSLPIWIFGAGF